MRQDVETLSPEAVAALACRVGAILMRCTGERTEPVLCHRGAGRRGAGVPETVRDAVLARAARLGVGARRLLDAVAVVPPRIERPLLDRLVPNADVALDECTTAGMLRAGAGRVSFRHELARLAIENTLPPGARRTLHRAVLAALGDVDPARLADHAEEAEDVEAILRFAPEAGERAAASRRAP